MSLRLFLRSMRNDEPRALSRVAWRAKYLKIVLAIGAALGQGNDMVDVIRVLDRLVTHGAAPFLLLAKIEYVLNGVRSSIRSFLAVATRLFYTLPQSFLLDMSSSAPTYIRAYLSRPYRVQMAQPVYLAGPVNISVPPFAHPTTVGIAVAINARPAAGISRTNMPARTWLPRGVVNRAARLRLFPWTDAHGVIVPHRAEI